MERGESNPRLSIECFKSNVNTHWHTDTGVHAWKEEVGVGVVGWVVVVWKATMGKLQA